MVSNFTRKMTPSQILHYGFIQLLFGTIVNYCFWWSLKNATCSLVMIFLWKIWLCNWGISKWRWKCFQFLFQIRMHILLQVPIHVYSGKKLPLKCSYNVWENMWDTVISSRPKVVCSFTKKSNISWVLQMLLNLTTFLQKILGHSH